MDLFKLLHHCISDFDYIIFIHHISKINSKIRLISNVYN